MADDGCTVADDEPVKRMAEQRIHARPCCAPIVEARPAKNAAERYPVVKPHCLTVGPGPCVVWAADVVDEISENDGLARAVHEYGLTEAKAADRELVDAIELVRVGLIMKAIDAEVGALCSKLGRRMDARRWTRGCPFAKPSVVERVRGVEMSHPP